MNEFYQIIRVLPLKIIETVHVSLCVAYKENKNADDEKSRNIKMGKTAGRDIHVKI